MGVKLSVIVPVFNVEQYLNKCIESILHQSFTDFELLLIDDGSTDKSPIICDEYQQKDQRIKVFHIQNSGPAAARNFGLLQALGEYIGFVDSDDWIETEMYKTLYNNAKISNADIAICDYIAEMNGEIRKIKSYHSENDVLSKNEISCLFTPYFFGYEDSEMNDYKEHCPFADYSSYIWLGIFKSDMLKKHRVTFLSEKLYFNEDNLFNLSAVYHAGTLFYCSRYFYHYLDYQNSFTKSFNYRYFDMRLNKYEYLRNFIKNFGLNDSYYCRLNNKICLETVSLISYYVNSKALGLTDKYKKIKQIVHTEVIANAFLELNMNAIRLNPLKIFLFLSRKKASLLLLTISMAYLLLRRTKRLRY